MIRFNFLYKMNKHIKNFDLKDLSKPVLKNLLVLLLDV